jgi:hypothetical protein
MVIAALPAVRALVAAEKDVVLVVVHAEGTM